MCASAPIAALMTTAKVKRRTTLLCCPSTNDRAEKTWYIDTMGCYSATTEMKPCQAVTALPYAENSLIASLASCPIP